MKPKRSAWQIVGCLLIGLLVLSLVTGGVGVAWYNRENPPVARQSYPFARPYNGSPGVLMRPGMTGGDSTFIREADEGTTRRVRQFFAAFAKALKEKNAAPEPWIDTANVLAQARLIAPPGLAYPNTEVNGGIAPKADGETRALTQALRSARAEWRAWDWDELVLHRVNEISPDTFDAFTSVPKPDGGRIKVRWMLTRNPFAQSFAIAHWADLETGRESTHDVALTMISHSNGAGLDRVLLNLRSLPEAHRAMDVRNYDEARKHLDIAARAQAPRPFRDAYELAEARYETLNYDDEVQAVDRLGGLLERDRDNLPAMMLQMRALAQSRQFEEIADLARRYQSFLGPDADALAWTGVGEAGLERDDQAKAIFEQALKLDPHQVTAIDGLLKLTPDAEKHEFIDRLAKLKHFRGLFHRLVETRGWYGDWKSLELLASAHRRRFPDDFSATRHLVQALMMQDQFAQVTKVFQAAIAKLADEPREKLLNEFLDSSAIKNRHREAYEAVPDADRGRAFEVAMQRWDYTFVDSGIELPVGEPELRDAIRAKSNALLELHGKTRADDTWVLLYKAKRENREGAPAAAEKSARVLLDRLKPAGDYSKDHQSGYAPARREWLLAKLKLGQSVAAYERFPNEETFNELAGECVAKDNAAELGNLLATREKAEAKTASRNYWRGELHWLKKDYLRCAAEMKSHLELSAEPGTFTPFQYQARDRLIRSWVKSSQPAAALEFLKAEEHPQPLLQALALASNKNSEEAEVLLIETMTAQPWLVTTAYRDPDLGPILQGPDFARLREKHPPPAPVKKPPMK